MEHPCLARKTALPQMFLLFSQRPSRLKPCGSRVACSCIAVSFEFTRLHPPQQFLSTHY